MSHATGKQAAFITRLAKQAGFESNVAAVNAYGFGLKSPSDLTASEASEVIEWLLSGANPVDSAPALELGTNFNSAEGTGRITTRLSDGRYLVKFTDGRSGFLTADQLTVA